MQKVLEVLGDTSEHDEPVQKSVSDLEEQLVMIVIWGRTICRISKPYEYTNSETSITYDGLV